MTTENGHVRLIDMARKRVDRDLADLPEFRATRKGVEEYVRLFGGLTEDTVGETADLISLAHREWYGMRNGSRPRGTPQGYSLHRLGWASPLEMSAAWYRMVEDAVLGRDA